MYFIWILRVCYNQVALNYGLSVQVQSGADGQPTLISAQGQVVPIQLPAGTNLQQVLASASGDNQVS